MYKKHKFTNSNHCTVLLLVLKLTEGNAKGEKNFQSSLLLTTLCLRKQTSLHTKAMGQYGEQPCSWGPIQSSIFHPWAQSQVK